MPEPTLQEHLIAELKLVRKRGVHRLPQYIGEVPALRELARRTSGADNAEHVENLLRTVYKIRSEGAQGTAIGLLLGLEQGRRGASPTVLREVAAARLGYTTPSIRSGSVQRPMQLPPSRTSSRATASTSATRRSRTTTR